MSDDPTTTTPDPTEPTEPAPADVGPAGGDTLDPVTEAGLEVIDEAPRHT